MPTAYATNIQLAVMIRSV